MVRAEYAARRFDVLLQCGSSSWAHKIARGCGLELGHVVGLGEGVLCVRGDAHPHLGERM